MTTVQAIDRYAKDIDLGVRASVYEGTKVPTEWRRDALVRDYDDADSLRKLAAQIKQHTLDHLDTYLEKAEAAMKANGVEVLFASTPDRARELALEVLQRENAKTVVKSKSMLSEEMHMNSFLEGYGVEVIETDLGEFIIQIDDDIPSHIIKPIVHKNRRDIAKSFEREGLGDYNDRSRDHHAPRPQAPAHRLPARRLRYDRR